MSIIPIRQDIEILPADEPSLVGIHDHLVITSKGKITRKGRYLKLGWTIKEAIGICIINSRAISKVTK